MGLETGEKLLVFGWGEGTLMLCKVSEMEKYAGYFAQRVEVARTAMEAVGRRLDTPTAAQAAEMQAAMKRTKTDKASEKTKKGKSRERRTER